MKTEEHIATSGFITATLVTRQKVFFDFGDDLRRHYWYADVNQDKSYYHIKKAKDFFADLITDKAILIDRNKQEICLDKVVSFVYTPQTIKRHLIVRTEKISGLLWKTTSYKWMPQEQFLELKKKEKSV